MGQLVTVDVVRCNPTRGHTVLYWDPPKIGALSVGTEMALPWKAWSEVPKQDWEGHRKAARAAAEAVLGTCSLKNHGHRFVKRLGPSQRTRHHICRACGITKRLYQWHKAKGMATKCPKASREANA